MGFILWVWGWGSMIYDPRVIYYCCVRVFEKLFEVEFRNLCFWRNGIMFRTKCGCGAPENENAPHFREIPSVAPEVFHCVRVGGGPLFQTYVISQGVNWATVTRSHSYHRLDLWRLLELIVVISFMLSRFLFGSDYFVTFLYLYIISAPHIFLGRWYSFISRSRCPIFFV